MCNDFLILLNFTPNSNVTNYPANIVSFDDRSDSTSRVVTNRN